MAVVDFSEGFLQPTHDHPPQSRLFMLEGLPLNLVLRLGSGLRIPPRLFAGHYDDPASSTFNRRDPFERYSNSQFRRRYAHSHRAEIDVLEHEWSRIYTYNTNVCRYLHSCDSKGLLYDEMRSYHILSFWSSPAKIDGSWDAVLLVNPPLTRHAKCLSSTKLVSLRRELRDESSISKYYLYPDLNPLQELPENSAEGSSAYRYSLYVSVVDDVLEDFTRKNPVVGDLKNPTTIVSFARKLVISTMLAFPRRHYVNLLRFQKTQVKPNQTLRNIYLSNFSEGALSSWHDEFFDFIVGSCAAMKDLIREMEENVVSLGLSIDNGTTCNSLETGEIQQSENDGWISILDLSRVVDSFTNVVATGYLQYITIQEARLWNGIAQNLSKITVLTMLFIPLTTVASIFSMGGEFLPGNSRARVFWVVSIPVSMLIAYSYWRQELFQALLKKRERLALLLASKEKQTEFCCA